MTRNEQLQEEFVQWLERYSPPRSIADNEVAAKAEIKALMRAILRFAPAQDYLSFLEKVTEQLDYQMKTRAWPTVSEVGAVCSNVSKTMDRKPEVGAAGEWALDPMKIAAKRMNAGEHVGDEWIYGRRAVEILAAGLIHMDTMRKYRSALYFSAKKVYGEEIAQRREAEWIAKHESAEVQHRKVQALPEGEPFKRMPTHENDQWAAE